MARGVDINISLIFLRYSQKSAARNCALLMLRRMRRLFFFFFFFSLFEAGRRATADDDDGDGDSDEYEREEISRLISAETGRAGGKLIKC